MNTLLIPDLAMLRHWLEQIGIIYYECDSCEALHLPHMQNKYGNCDAKLDVVDEVLVFSCVAELHPKAVLHVSAELSQINASFLTAKAFIDIQDDDLPRFIACQTLSSSAGISIEQFTLFMQECEEQISSIMHEVMVSGALIASDEEEPIIEEVVQHRLH